MTRQCVRTELTAQKRGLGPVLLFPHVRVSALSNSVPTTGDKDAQRLSWSYVMNIRACGTATRIGRTYVSFHPDSYLDWRDRVFTHAYACLPVADHHGAGLECRDRARQFECQRLSGQVLPSQFLSFCTCGSKYTYRMYISDNQRFLFRAAFRTWALVRSHADKKRSLPTCRQAHR